MYKVTAHEFDSDKSETIGFCEFDNYDSIINVVAKFLNEKGLFKYCLLTSKDNLDCDSCIELYGSNLYFTADIMLN